MLRSAKRAGALLFAVLLTSAAAIYLHPLRVITGVTRFHLWRTGVRSRFVQAGGYRLHYFEAPPPAGAPDRPLVLIHGLGARGEDWAALIPGLASQGFHVYVPDLLGYGRSAHPDVDYSIALQEQTVVAFMDAVHVGQAEVGGWSMGGWVALKLAADHPERVDRLMLYDSAGIYFPATFGPELFVPTDRAGLAKLISTLTPRPPKLPEFVERDALRELARNRWVIERSVAAMVNGRDLMDFRLHLIRQPTLVVWGSRDDLIPLPVGEAIHRGIAGSELAVVDGCGHMAPLECPEPVRAVTIDFLRAEPASVGGERRVPGR